MTWEKIPASYEERMRRQRGQYVRWSPPVHGHTVLYLGTVMNIFKARIRYDVIPIIAKQLKIITNS
jgi:hypothetical protein